MTLFTGATLEWGMKCLISTSQNKAVSNAPVFASLLGNQLSILSPARCSPETSQLIQQVPSGIMPNYFS